MKRRLYLLLLIAVSISRSNAQTAFFGAIDTADLKMPFCDFEKDAHAEVLFDDAYVTYDGETIFMRRHKRIKIFSEKGKDEANVRIAFLPGRLGERITDIKAETINLDHNAITYTKVDTSQIFAEQTNKFVETIVFTFPNVHAGSVVEFAYTWSTPERFNYPDWLFQDRLPTRYSQFDGSFNREHSFDVLKYLNQPMARDTVIKASGSNDIQHIWALSNVKSFTNEPYMDYPNSYIQGLIIRRGYNNWHQLGFDMLNDFDFGRQLDETLPNEKEITRKANDLPNRDEKIAWIFNTVKRSVKWDKQDEWYTIDGIKKAWDKKTGNSAEINLILYHLLKAAKIRASLILLCSRDNGKFNPRYASAGYFNRTAVYCPFDTANYYVLDASRPYNTYRDVPLDLMGLTALLIDPETKMLDTLAIKVGAAKEITLVDGEINTAGEVTGTAQLSSSASSREKYLESYAALGEEQYKQQFCDAEKKLSFSSLKLDNAENDTLPLIQTFAFKYKGPDPDNDYLYIKPTVFTSFGTNPFTSESRVANIDFGCRNAYTIIGHYKIPAGYSVSSLPKSLTMQLPDQGIVFKRMLSAQDNFINVRFVIDFNRTLYTGNEYAAIRDFYKKMYEMLDEQIVLKKS